MARKLKKSRNGQGNSITLNFNTNDPQEAAALAMSKRLAGMKKGKRKDFIVAMLAAAEHIYQETGQIIDTYEIGAAIMGSASALGHQYADLTVITQTPNSQISMGSKRPPRVKQQTNSAVELTGKASKANAETVAKNFLSSMKGLASVFFD